LTPWLALSRGSCIRPQAPTCGCCGASRGGKRRSAHRKAAPPLLTERERRALLDDLIRERGPPEWEDPLLADRKPIIQRIEYGQPLTAVERKQVSLALRRQWLSKLEANAYQRQLVFKSIEVLRHILKLRERVTGVRLNPADRDWIVRKFHNRSTDTGVTRFVSREKRKEKQKR
jgi:hypothetical protein